MALLLSSRLDRLRELGVLAGRHAAGPAGLRALLACYAATFRDPLSEGPIELPLRVDGRRRVVRMRASDIYIIAEIFHERQYQLSRPLGPAPYIVDAGANIGIASTWFLLRYPDARILACEPIAANFAYLERNIGSEAQVILRRLALGEEEGEVAMALAGNAAEHAVGGRPGAAGTVVVPGRRLDTVLDEVAFPRIDLLKLDVEGSELAVLRGLGARLAQVRALVAEVHERLIDVPEFYAMLSRHGFTIVRKQYYREGIASGVHTVEAWRSDSAPAAPAHPVEEGIS